MRKLKITVKIAIALLVIIPLTIMVYRFFSGKPHQTEIPDAPNSFVAEIRQKTKNIRNAPITSFCDKEYQGVKNDIKAYADSNKLDTIYKESLSKDLDFAYISVFIGQANNVFNGTTWEPGHIHTIRTETIRLLNSKYIENKTELNTIKSILDKYDEVMQFLANSDIFSKDMRVTRVDQEFDFVSTKDFITRAANYHKMRHIVNNCSRIQSQLAAIPSSMYNKHLGYLRNKVEYCAGKYQTLPEYGQYYDKIYKPVHVEFQTLSENYLVYSVAVTTPDEDLTPLKERLKKDRDSAFLYLKP